MWTTTSPFPADEYRGRPSAFNNHTGYDPFLPSSPAQEDVLQADSDAKTPDVQMSCSQFKANQFSQSSTPSAWYSSTHAGNQDGTPRTSTGTSPKVLDHIFGSLNDFTGDDIGGFDFTFDDSFEPLPFPENIDTNFLDDILIATTHSASDEVTTVISPSEPPVSRKSTGLATLSSHSHLMSPTLTDETASPASPCEVMYSTDYPHTRLLGGGKMSRTSSQNTAVDSMHLYGQIQAQATPALTRASALETSEPGSIRQFSSPIVRIETYSRGDSPARADLMARTGSKRSRTSQSRSYLAAPSEGSEQGGNELSFEDRGAVLAADDLYRTTCNGINPVARPHELDDYVTSLNEQGQQAELQAKNTAVSKWLVVDDSGPGAYVDPNPPIGIRKYETSGGRPRAKSTSIHHELKADAFGSSRGRQAAEELKIPGPNVLLHEASEEEDEDETASYSDSVPASIDGTAEEAECLRSGSISPNGETEAKPQDAYPWIDPIYFPSQEGYHGQPGTSQAAIMRFARRAADVETASRAATWGTTNRRMSDGDLQRVFGSGGLLSRLSITRSKDKDKDETRSTFKESIDLAAAKFRSIRNSNTNKRKSSEPVRPFLGHNDSERKSSHTYSRKNSLRGAHERKESHSSVSASLSLTRSLSGKRPRSPKINTSTSGLVATLATQVATLGAHSRISPTAASPSGAWSRENLKRTLRDGFSRHSSHEGHDSGPCFPWHQHGGVSRYTLSPPTDDEPAAGPSTQAPPIVKDELTESDRGGDDKGVQMDLAPRHDLIIPTFDGFKMNIRDVNPRLEKYLVERLGQEQLRRYKKLVEFKVKHAQAKHFGSCESEAQCADKGGQPIYFPPKAAQKEPTMSHTGFTVATLTGMDEDEEAAADGVVTEAQFPPGVPMPPVKRLPAQFECPLCFQVKKFLKPSDWSKHVHEDLQPFTCTFPICADPKSFKRKADWVRHENERHRQLEWWQCTEDGCSHQCYRRDNFVQHLIREHKMPEPKAKTMKSNKPAVRGPAKVKAKGHQGFIKDIPPEEKVLYMVETCRHETTKMAIEEPCRFCGNVCNSFKKLTVHLARHMEQISMPILDLVKQKEVDPDTIVSPIEQRLPRASLPPAGQQNLFPSLNLSDTLALSNPNRTAPVQRSVHGSFVSLQASSTFIPNTYEGSVFQWPQPGNEATHVQRQEGPMPYNNELGDSYPPCDGPLPFGGVHGQTSYMQQPGTLPSSNVYMLDGQATHGLEVPYNTSSSYEVRMDTQAQFASPYVNVAYAEAVNGDTSQRSQSILNHEQQYYEPQWQ